MTFWSSVFVWDAVNYLAPCVGILIAFAAFNVEAFVGEGRTGDVLLLLLLYGWAVLPFMYVLSFVFVVPSSGLVWLTMFNILSGKTSDSFFRYCCVLVDTGVRCKG